MSKRAVAVFCTIILFAFCVMLHTLMLSLSVEYVSAAGRQSRYTVTVCRTRGRIYDRYLRPLAGGRLEYRAVIAPSREVTRQLIGVLSAETLNSISDDLTGTHPFVCTVENADADGCGAVVYPAQKRYGGSCIAPHVVGYLGAEGQGVSGIERAYDEYLAAASGEMTARFTIDAKGAGLAGIKPELTDTTDASLAGVVLTIDADIQTLAQKAAELYIEKGAIVVLEVPTGEIRACVSAPAFEPDNVAASLESEDAPLLNRAISAYDIGSVFKIVVASAALESGIPEDYTYECTGSVDVSGSIFHCADRAGHGVVDMEHAFAASCNCCFIDLAQRIGADRLLEYAGRFGFGRALQLTQNYATAQGCLPSRETLTLPAALANLSFGQGELMATPVHVAAMTLAAVDGGVFVEPSLAERLVDSGLATVSICAKDRGRRVVSEQTAERLLGFMTAAADYGTAARGAGDQMLCAGKTGTAETGIFVGGHRVKQAWFTGCFPAENPRFVVTVLVEDGASGGKSSAPVFKFIADGMAGLCREE